MSAETRLVKACPDCGSSQLQTRGRSIRALDGEPNHYCKSCQSVVKAEERPERCRTPDKPPRGLARRVWEYGEQQRNQSND